LEGLKNVTDITAKCALRNRGDHETAAWLNFCDLRSNSTALRAVDDPKVREAFRRWDKLRARKDGDSPITLPPLTPALTLSASVQP
jgi:hypothetical protein